MWKPILLILLTSIFGMFILSGPAGFLLTLAGIFIGAFWGADCM